MGKYSFVKSPLSTVLRYINSKDFSQNYVNEDGSIKKEFIDIVYPNIQEALGNKSNSVAEPISIKESGISYNDQMDRAKEYISSILSKVKYGSNDWQNFVKSINNAITDIGEKGSFNPYTLFPIGRNPSANILSNTTFYIWHRIPKDEAQLYMNKLPPIKSAISVIDDENKRNFGKTIDQQSQTIKQQVQTIEEQGKTIEKGKKIVNKQQEKLTDAQILRNEVDEVKADIKQLLKKNKSDILNDVALRLAGNPDLKKNIRKIKGDLKASNPNYSDGDINYIITKALSENDRYLKTVAANPDLFDRDMSQDTIQKENEQFQSKLRQQNLRYILPKFIERREKLVENTLNPELLKGAFAI